MSSLSFLEEEKTCSKNNQSKPIFNSKLFFHLDINAEEKDYPNNENNAKEETYYLNELEQKNYLSNDLIKDLNIDDINDTLNNNNISNENYDDNITKSKIINSLISLAKGGYEFKPKNYKPEKNNIDKENNYRNGNHINTKYNKNKYKKGKGNVNDWICPFCKNLNFAFRKICNKCKVSKVHSDSNINNNLCVL